jgi:hypothetical protein
MTDNNTLTSIVETFYDKCTTPSRPLPRRVMKGMTDAEFDIVSATFCEEFETGAQASREQQIQVADIFARAAQRVSLDQQIMDYIPVEKTDEKTAKALEGMNAPALAKLVNEARRKQGLAV